VMYKEITENLEGHYRNHWLTVACCSQPITESLPQSATIIKWLAHQILIGPPQYFIQKAGAHAFIDRIKDQEVKFSLLMGGERRLTRHWG
jgi:hypothetical protein